MVDADRNRLFARKMGLRLKAARTAAGQARADAVAEMVAAGAPVTLSTWRNWELGRSAVPTNALAAVASVVGVTTAHLLGEAE